MITRGKIERIKPIYLKEIKIPKKLKIYFGIVLVAKHTLKNLF